jgi:signal transduction histidine kinase
MGEQAGRVRRELAEDLAYLGGAAVTGAVLLVTRVGASGPGPITGHPVLAVTLDVLIGAAGCVMLCFRRRWPVGVAVATVIPMVLSLSGAGPGYAALLNVSVRRRIGVALAMAALRQVATIVYFLLWIRSYPFWLVWAFILVEQAAVVAWGAYLRARGQLLASLRDRVAQAEATQQLLADQARFAERARIAEEMHDVLAHRVSLMALHAGALEVRPDLAPSEVARTAGLIRLTARQALEELRGVVGVLTSEQAAAPTAPQPALPDIPALVAESRAAGLAVELEMRVEAAESAPGALGRDTYRIVREALTNVSKHARGEAASVSVTGRPGSGLLVVIRNRRPSGPDTGPALPGSGMGLASLAERVSLSGGTLTHGPGPDGSFVVQAALLWPA